MKFLVISRQKDLTDLVFITKELAVIRNVELA